MQPDLESLFGPPPEKAQNSSYFYTLTNKGLALYEKMPGLQEKLSEKEEGAIKRIVEVGKAAKALPVVSIIDIAKGMSVRDREILDKGVLQAVKNNNRYKLTYVERDILRFLYAAPKSYGQICANVKPADCLPRALRELCRREILSSEENNKGQRVYRLSLTEKLYFTNKKRWLKMAKAEQI